MTGVDVCYTVRQKHSREVKIERFFPVHDDVVQGDMVDHTLPWKEREFR